MAKKTYQFPHELGTSPAAERVRPFLQDLSRQFNLALDAGENGAFKLHRTGIAADVAITESEVLVSVDLNWFLEKTIRAQIEDGLHEKLVPLLK